MIVTPDINYLDDLANTLALLCVYMNCAVCGELLREKSF